MSDDGDVSIGKLACFFMVLWLFALTFCGTPDLHDALLKRVNEQCGVAK